MAGVASAAPPVLDLQRYELTVEGRPVRLERQPMELLAFLAERSGRLVTREEIVERLWGKDVHVDSDGSINAAIRKIRAALKDDPARPQYLETVVGKGYRLTSNLAIVTGEQSAAAQPRRAASYWILGIVAIAAGAIIWTLLAWRTQPAGIHAIAVMPLANLSGDPSQNYFADGMTEALTTDLGKIGSLMVVSRTSATAASRAHQTAAEIGRALHVDALIEGSVIRSGNRVRITVQLIDTVHDHHLWADSYDRELGDVLAVQSTVALDIARQVRARLTPVEQQRLAHASPVNADAYDAYLRGRYLQTTQDVETLKEALPAFQRAIDLDPGYAPAYAGLADSYSLLANYGVLASRDAFPAAQAAAQKAIELDAVSAEAHTALAYPLHHYAWDWAGAEREYKTALGLNPSYATARLRYAEYLSSVGRQDEAIAQMHRALDLDPLSLVYLSNLGTFLYQARRYDEAIQVLTQVLTLDPGRMYARIYLAMSYEEKSMYDDARHEYQAVATREPGVGLAQLDARTGNRVEATRIADRLRGESGGEFLLAGVYAQLGDRDQAFACLDRAYQSRDYFLVLLKVHPYMDPLRSDPRYGALLHKIGLDTAN
jgi:TolB-like protein/DNA-binding winged helix-turn-helix (wHTH) protein/Tfp pilus assembly protein PilF